MSLEDHLPESPPPEVRRAIEAALEAYDVLSATAPASAPGGAELN